MCGTNTHSTPPTLPPLVFLKKKIEYLFTMGEKAQQSFWVAFVHLLRQTKRDCSSETSVHILASPSHLEHSTAPSKLSALSETHMCRSLRVKALLASREINTPPRPFPEKLTWHCRVALHGPANYLRVFYVTFQANASNFSALWTSYEGFRDTPS